MSAPVLTGRLRIKDETEAGLKQTEKNITGTFKDIAKTAAGFLAADLVKGLVSVGKESIQLGSQAETLQKAFNALKGDIDDSALSLDTLRKSVDGTVSDIDLLTSANQAMALGLPTEDLNDLFEAARVVGAAMGRDTTQAVQDLTTGIGRQSRLILDNLGIIVDTEAAYDRFAATLGKTAAQLSEDERKTAFMTAAIDALNAKAETLTGTISETQTGFQQYASAITNLKTEIGEALLPVVADLLTSLSGAITTVLDLIDMAKSGDWEGIAEVINAAFENLGRMLWETITNIDWNWVFESLGRFAIALPVKLAVAFATFGVELAKTIEKTDWVEVFSSMLMAWGSFIRGFFEELFTFLPQWLKDLVVGKATNRSPLPSTAPAEEPDVLAQSGFRGIVTGPTSFMAGEAGPELVNISPLTSTQGAVGDHSIQIHIGSFIGLDDASTRRNLARALADVDVDELLRRGVRP